MALRRTFISNKLSTQLGFSLFEVLIVMSMVAVIASATMLFSYNYYENQLLTTEKGNLILLLQSARANAMQNVGEQDHGVAIDPSGYQGYVVFVGNNFDDSDESLHVYVPRAENFSFSANYPEVIIFEQLSGESNIDSEFELNSTHSGASTTVTINYEGAIY
ncbi:prepilin-type N-terminal cleavage/methylation domain-containing protein [Patescibacteria group bacterium]|nr:prepilin-type N-terminal cleavage/methylation domain-containing protein [Patescibacteria group bacterium]